MDNEFSYDEYNPALEEETVILTKEVPEDTDIEVKITTKKKEKPKFKFSPKMLIAPGVLVVLLLLDAVQNFITVLCAAIAPTLPFESDWAALLLPNILNLFLIALGLIIAALAGLLYRRNVGKALEFVAVLYGSWGVGKTACSVLNFVFSIIRQLVIRYSGEVLSDLIVSAVNGILGYILIPVVAIVVCVVFTILIEKADAKKAEAASEDEAELPKKKISIDIKQALLMLLAAIAVTGVQLLYYEILERLSNGSWAYIANGIGGMIEMFAAVILFAGIGLLATKKITGTIRFYGAYMISWTVFTATISVFRGVYNLLYVTGTLSSAIITVNNIMGYVLQFFLIVFAVVLVILYGCNVSLKKKVKARDGASDIAEEIEEAVEDIEEVTEEIIE